MLVCQQRDKVIAVLTILGLLLLTATITPATLIVVASQQSSNATQSVSTINLTAVTGQVDWHSSHGVSPTWARLTSTTATGLRILPMDVVYPTLKCESPDNTTLATIDLLFDSSAHITWDTVNNTITADVGTNMNQEGVAFRFMSASRQISAATVATTSRPASSKIASCVH